MKQGPNHMSYHSVQFYERPFFQYIIVLSILATLIISIIALVNVYQLKKSLMPVTINANDFLKKLTTHEEMESYVGVAPLNIVQVSNNNLATLQSQVSGLDTSYLGNFLVQYADRVVIYDYDKDAIRGTVSLQQPQAQLPPDFFTKLNRHEEAKGLEKEQPIGGQLDEQSLATLNQQFPDVYKDAKAGHFLLRYKTKLIIYDYDADRIINTVNLT